MNVLVTGSSGSLGSHVSQALLREGFAVHGLDVVQPKPEFLASLTDAEAANWRYSEVDLTKAEAFAAVLAGEEAAPDLVINNAGWLYSAPLLSFKLGKLTPHDVAEWDRALDINLNAAFYVLSQSAQRMISSRKKGVIINVSSISGKGNLGQAAYSAAKSGLNALTTVAAKELGRFGIRVAAIAPGFLDTESTHNAVSEETLSTIRKAIPLGRLGTADELYHAVKFVMENSYFHGKILELDGGLSF